MKRKSLIISFIGVFLFIQPIRAQTWTASKRLTWNSENSSRPSIAVDSSQNIHVVWYDETPGNPEIYYKRSTNGGGTWASSKRLTWNSSGSYFPAIGAGPGNTIHVVWHDHAPGNQEIFYRRSTDGGVTWGGTKRLTWTAGSSVAPAIAVGSGGTVHMVWVDWTPGNPEIYYKRSTDGGVTWGGVKRLPWNSGYSINPSIAVDSSNNIHVVWDDDTPGNEVIYYKKSTNGGVTWSGIKKLTWDSEDSYFPEIAIESGNNIHLVWTSLSEIHNKRSTDGGVTWGSVKRLSWNSGLSSNPALAVDMHSGIYVIWGDWTPGNAEIYYKRSTNGGATWGSAKRLTWNSEDSKFAALATDSDDSIHVVWQNDTSSNVEIYYRKGIQ